MADTDFIITLEGFHEGNAPLAHVDDSTFMGNKGQAAEMKADIVSNPGFLQQAPGLTDLTNGTQAGVVTELIRHILDEPTATDTTYAVGTSKLFKLTASSVVSGGSPSWPQTVTNMTEGESVIRLKANLYTFYNKASGGDIARMPLSTEVITANWGSSTDEALENAPHPAAATEDILLFGNGRYVGVYIEGEAILDVKKLDFGQGAEVADIIFHSNLWWIAVNYGEGRRGKIYLYDASAISNQLSDEAGIGRQKIGFLYVHNGIVYVAYDDKTADGFAIGWVQGRMIKPLKYFKGSLPTHRQKTLYKNTVLFITGENVLACGAAVEQLPVQVSTLADAGYATVGSIAAPFGVPMVSSSDGGGNYRLAKFSDFSLSSNWKSVYIDVTKDLHLGHVDKVVVFTKQLEEGAQANIVIKGNQGAHTSNTLTVSDTTKTRHIFKTITLPNVEDIRIEVDYASGSTTETVPIRKIVVLGNFVESV